MSGDNNDISGDVVRQEIGSGQVLHGKPQANRSILKQLDDDGLASVNNFDGDQIAQWRLQSLATGADCLGFEDLPDGGIDPKYFFAHRIEMVSTRDGEIIQPVRIVIIDHDSKAYGFVSDYLAKAVDDLITLFGWGPWQLPAKIRIVSSQSRKKLRFYSIQPVL